MVRRDMTPQNETRYAQEVGIDDLMPEMEIACIALVKAILVVLVSESLDEPNFVDVEKRVGDLVKIARQLRSCSEAALALSFPIPCGSITAAIGSAAPDRAKT